MSHVHVDGFDTYIDYLPLHTQEAAAPFNSILVNVTGFFRDPEAWEVLRAEALPALIPAAMSAGRLRVWSAANAELAARSAEVRRLLVMHSAVSRALHASARGPRRLRAGRADASRRRREVRRERRSRVRRPAVRGARKRAVLRFVRLVDGDGALQGILGLGRPR
jgi:CheR methyltransferase, SAM binding domain